MTRSKHSSQNETIASVVGLSGLLDSIMTGVNDTKITSTSLPAKTVLSRQAENVTGATAQNQLAKPVEVSAGHVFRISLLAPANNRLCAFATFTLTEMRMKLLNSSSLIAVISLFAINASAAFKNVATDCNATYSVTADNLVVGFDTMEDNEASIGYELSESIFGLAVTGCREPLVMSASRQLLCGSLALGALTRLESGDQDEPTYSLSLNSSRNFTVTGSCDQKKHAPLTLNIR